MSLNPRLCQVSTEFLILIKEIRMGGAVGNVNHQISIGHDGSVYMKEVLVSLSKDEVLHNSLSHTFDEFAGKFPEDARIIREFVNKGVLTIPGMDKRCEV